MKDGEDFPVIYCQSSVFMKNNIVLFGGIDSNVERNNDSNDERNNVFNIYNLETRTWS